MIHIIVGDEAAKQLQAAFELDENLKGPVVILKDNLAIGPIASAENQEIGHDALRSACWNTMLTLQDPMVMRDQEQIEDLIPKALEEEEPFCLWLAPNVADVMAYIWLLPIFKKYPSVFHTINIIGLPFLNEKGQLFYPTNFAQIPAKEFSKTKRLLKEVTPAEYEVEGDEWSRLQQDATWARCHDGGKKISSKENDFYDHLLKSALTPDFQKAHKVVNDVVKKSMQLIPSTFFEYRLRRLIHQEAIALQGDISKTTREFEVKKIGEPSVAEPVTTEETV
jgi:hypothetical protein